MKNLLALAAFAVLVVVAVGYMRGWYHIQATPEPNGQNRVTIDINTNKVKQDLETGENKVKKIINNPKLTPPTGTPANTVVPPDVKPANYTLPQIPPASNYQYTPPALPPVSGAPSVYNGPPSMPVMPVLPPAGSGTVTLPAPPPVPSTPSKASVPPATKPGSSSTDFDGWYQPPPY